MESSGLDKTSSSHYVGPTDPSARDRQQLKAACRDMESLFIDQLFKEMRKSQGDGMAPSEKSLARTTYQEMMDTELSKTMAAAGGMGIASVLERQLEGTLPQRPQDSAEKDR